MCLWKCGYESATERTGAFFAWNCRHYRWYKITECNCALISFLYVVSTCNVWFICLLYFMLFISFLFLFYLLCGSADISSKSEYLSRLIFTIASGEYRRTYVHIIHVVTGHLGKLYRSPAFRWGEGQRGKKKAAKHCEGLQNGARKIRDRCKVVGREECSSARTLVVVV